MKNMKKNQRFRFMIFTSFMTFMPQLFSLQIEVHRDEIVQPVE